jgi:hypothetical protein
MQTRYQVPHLAVSHQTDTLNPFQYLKHPPQGRVIGRLVDLMQNRLVLTGSCPAQTTLGHRIDQQRQGHHHQQLLDAAGFVHKQR